MLQEAISLIAILQLVAAMVIVLAFLVRFIGSLYAVIWVYFMKVHLRNNYFIEYLENRNAFTEWKKEREWNE